jgi:hypothetical protein
MTHTFEDHKWKRLTQAIPTSPPQRLASMFRLLCAGLFGLALTTLVVDPGWAEGVPGAVNPAAFPSYPNYPTRYSPAGVPEYGRVGGEQYTVAGIVNAGEPSIRVVYDETIPGTQQIAMTTLAAIQSHYAMYPQPGITDGLREAAYTAHFDGVQVQVYSNAPIAAPDVTSTIQSVNGLVLNGLWFGNYTGLRNCPRSECSFPSLMRLGYGCGVFCNPV